MSTLADRIQSVGSIINYQFQGTGIIKEALSLAGAGGISVLTHPVADGNKRLAMVGDAIIKVVLVLDGYDAGQSKGAISNTLGTTGSNGHLSSVGFAKNIGPYIYTNPSQAGTKISSGLMATTVEAIMGAVYLDSGNDIEAVKRAMLALEII